MILRSAADREILRRADEIKRAEKSARPARPKAERKVVARGERTKDRQRDLPFLSWLHVDMPCIACVIEGPVMQAAFSVYGAATVYQPYPVEAAHQKHVDGKGGLLGKRPDDAGHTCPLCAWHHRLAPNACDPAQRKFWARLKIDVGAFCRELYNAFKNGESGTTVVQRFAETSKADK